MNILRILFLVIIPAVLLITAYGGYRYGVEMDVFQGSSNSTVKYEVYDIQKTEQWKNRFDSLEDKNFNTVKRKIVGSRQNFLEVRRGHQTYLIEYDAEVDVQLIQSVQEVKQAQDNTQYSGRYFLVQYDRFVEIVYFDITKSTTPLSSEVANGTYQAEICLQLPIEATSNVRYHIDSRNNIWIVTASMNKVVFIQVFSGLSKQLVKQFRYILDHDELVNEVLKIIRKDEDCMFIEVLTYGLTTVSLQVCPYNEQKSIRQASHRKTSNIKYSQVETSDFQVIQAYSEQVRNQQFNRVVQYIINLVTFRPTSSQLYKRTPSIDEHELRQFDTIVIDEPNNYLINLSKNKTVSGIMSLNKYLINAKSPLFHDNPHYSKYDILNVLDKEYKKEYSPNYEHKYIIPGLNQTKKVAYKAAYRTYPDIKVEHMGLGNALLIYYPQQKLEEKDYVFIRTHDGGIVSEGTRFKGTFDKVPVKFEEVYQIVDSKAQQVVPSIFEVQIGYFNLMTYLVQPSSGDNFLRVQLLNMLGGKPVLTHYISVKKGYTYTSTMLLNNQWWILEYNKNQKQSMATKYQIYTNASNPTQLLNIKRVYGVIGSQQHLDREDDLAAIMHQFTEKYRNGYVLLNVYRCIDQYYYVEYTDASGNHYGIARIHFKNFSNRRAKKSKQYAGAFERLLVLEETQMIPEKYSRQPISVVLHNVSIFDHLPNLQKQENKSSTWHTFCQSENGKNLRKLQKLGGFYYFPINYYAKGTYGCDFNSDRPHSEKIYAFNMRNIIINGKIMKEDKSEMRKAIVMNIFYLIPCYLLALTAFYIWSKFNSQDPKERPQQKLAPESKKKKKEA